MNKEELKKDLEMAKKYLSVAERAMIAATASWDSVTRVMNTAESFFKEADEAFRKNRTPKLEEDLKEAHNTLRIAQDLWTAAGYHPNGMARGDYARAADRL